MGRGNRAPGYAMQEYLWAAPVDGVRVLLLHEVGRDVDGYDVAIVDAPGAARMRSRGMSRCEYVNPDAATDFTVISQPYGRLLGPCVP